MTPTKIVACNHCGAGSMIKCTCLDCEHHQTFVSAMWCDKGRTGTRICKEFKHKKGGA